MTIRKQGAKAASRRGKGKGGKTRGRKRGYGQLPPKGSQRITLAAAVALTQRYRKASPASEHGGFYWADGVQELLDQPGCVGLRYYHGLGADYQYEIVLVGVDANGNDITTTPRRKSARSAKAGAVAAAGGAVAAATGDAVILDTHWPCPPYCPNGSVLL